MTTAQPQAASPDGFAPGAPPRMLWLEVTGRCQLACVHCYAGSGPDGSHGVMDRQAWLEVIGQAADLGVRLVQFIGGEPSLHPDLPALISAAAGRGLRVEVFSNLVHVRPALWECFAEHDVTVATSWYSDSPAEHAAVTGRRSHARTRAGIARAVDLGLDVRVGLIGVLDGQRTAQARADLLTLGVPAAAIGYDRLRQVGRGVRDPGCGDTPAQLCGQCADQVAAIAPSGDVWPCVFARWMPLGNVRTQPLAAILGEPLRRARRTLFPGEAPAVACRPTCSPGCSPTSACSPRCYPGCRPHPAS